MATATRIDPFRTFNFRIEIDGLTVGAFRECSGLTADGNSVEYREGTDVARTVRKMPGLLSYGNIMMGRGYTPNRELWDLVHQHRQRPERPAKWDDRADERGARRRACGGTLKTCGSRR